MTSAPIPESRSHHEDDSSAPLEDEHQVHTHNLHHGYQTASSSSSSDASDAVVVQPSFDDSGAAPTIKSYHHDASSPPRSTRECQARSPDGDDKEADDAEERNPSSPTEHHPPQRRQERRGSHTRNLSALFDATTISDEIMGPEQQSFDEHSASRKHRRMFSGDVPNMAHRRLNSVGQSAQVSRRHHREDSGGLDILSAAANATKDEIAAVAAGSRNFYSRRPAPPSHGGDSPSGTHAWEPPHVHPRSSLGQVSSASSSSYDPPSSYGPPPPQPSSERPQHHQMDPPPHRRSAGAYVLPPPQPYINPYPGTYHHYPPPPPGAPIHGSGSSYYSHHYVNSLPPGYTHHVYNPRPPPEYYAPRPGTGETVYRSEHRPEEDPRTVYRRDTSPPPPVASEWGEAAVPPPQPESSSSVAPRDGPHHQGSQTFVTAISVGHGKRTMAPTTTQKHAATNTEARSSIPSEVGHHRKLSSFSSLGTILGSSLFPTTPGEGETKKGHHRVTSSSVSLLQGLEVGIDDANFLRNLQASNSAANSAYRESPTPVGSNSIAVRGSGHSPSPPRQQPSSVYEGQDDADPQPSKLAAGGTSKRVRRKCQVDGCTNRVVQGGLCISHGAKRKTCKHPGCTKNVKKAGLCSTHGPARKRCEQPGCPKVAVQGGRCIAHGAKKKLCSVEDCTKQAILSGMCKKHHDQQEGKKSDDFCRPCPSSKDDSPVAKTHKPTHTRGLSIFQEMSADAVSSILNDPSASQPREPRVSTNGARIW